MTGFRSAYLCDLGAIERHSTWKIAYQGSCLGFFHHVPLRTAATFVLTIKT